MELVLVIMMVWLISLSVWCYFIDKWFRELHKLVTMQVDMNVIFMEALTNPNGKTVETIRRAMKDHADNVKAFKEHRHGKAS